MYNLRGKIFHMNNKRIYITMLLSAISIMISMAINFILTPYITNTVGAEAYGFVSLARNFISFANILMIALNSYASRFLTISYLQKDTKRFHQYYSTVFIADFIVGGILFLLGLIYIFNIKIFLNVSSNLLKDVQLLFLLTFASFYLTTLSTIFSATAYVKDKLGILNVIKCMSYIAEAFVLLGCYICFRPYIWYVGLASLGMAVITFGGSVIMTNRILPKVHIKISHFSIEAVKELLLNGLWNSANSLGNSLNSGLDLLITNLMLNELAMGQVSIAKTLSGIVYQLYETISQPFQPTFLRNYSQKDKTQLLDNLKQAMCICGMFTNTIFAGFCAIGVDFLGLWIPTQNIKLIYGLTILAMLPSIAEGCMYPAYYIYTLTLKNKIPCIVTIIGGAVNVGAMYILLKYTKMGAFAVLITTAVVMAVVNLVTNPIYMSKCLKIKSRYIYSTLIKNILACGAATVVLVGINSRMQLSTTWKAFVVKLVMLAFVGIVIQVPILFSKQIVKKLNK